MVYGKHGGWTKCRFNGALHQMLDGQISPVNGQDQIFRPENYYNSSLRVRFIDKVKIRPSKDYYDSPSIYIYIYIYIQDLA